MHTDIPTARGAQFIPGLSVRDSLRQQNLWWQVAAVVLPPRLELFSLASEVLAIHVAEDGLDPHPELLLLCWVAKVPHLSTMRCRQ